MSRRIGDVRADGAVCVKIEWVSRDACGSGFYDAPLGVDVTRDIKCARRFAKREEAEDKELDWEAVRVVTWRKQKRRKVFGSALNNREALVALDGLVTGLANEVGGSLCYRYADSGWLRRQFMSTLVNIREMLDGAL